MIVFDEKKYAERMIKKGFQTKHKNVYELYILAKYYFHLDKDVEQVKNNLIKFCEKYIDYFSTDEWYNIINKTVLSAQKGHFVTNKEAHITKNELDKIQQLEKLNEQKVAFVMLILYKFHDYRKFEISIEDLYRLCKLSLNSKTKLAILQSLTQQGYIDISMGGKRWVKFTDKKGTPEIIIKNFDDFIYEYLRYIGEKGYGECVKCGKAIKLTNNRKKYCKDCWEEEHKKQDREYQKRKYHSRLLDESQNT